MVIFEARIWNENIAVIKLKVKIETDELFIFRDGSRVSRSNIGLTDSMGTGYGYTIDEAVEAVKKYIRVKIDNNGQYLKLLNEQLNYTIKQLD